MKTLSVLVVGSGGREHAIVQACAASQLCKALHAAPGNPGMEQLAQCHFLDSCDAEALLQLCTSHSIDLVIIGTEAPLAAGVADSLRKAGLAVFGPGRDGAQLEASKAFSKAFMMRHHIPTARFITCHSLDETLAALETFSPPYVVKASGLAAGKGVFVENSLEAAQQACVELLEQQTLGVAGTTVVVEKGLRGHELSVMIVTDGTTWKLLATSQDHKRLLDGDKGPNTGGMGAYGPVPWITDVMMKRIINEVVEPSIAALAAENIDYRGVLYAGLMIASDGKINVLEYNVRLGDPETEVLLPLYDGDWLQLCLATATGRLSEVPDYTTDDAALCVILASKNYPVASSSPQLIRGLDAPLPQGVTVFHCGTSRNDAGEIMATGGRVLCISSRAATLEEAAQKAYETTEIVSFDGMQFRRDIGKAVFAKENLL